MNQYNLAIEFRQSQDTNFKLGFLQNCSDKNLFSILDSDKQILVQNFEINNDILYGDEAIEDIYLKLDIADIQNLMKEYCTKTEYKKFYHQGHVKYEGEVTNDKYNGKGTEYDVNGNVIFWGEFENGERLQGCFTDSKQNFVLESKFPIVFGVPNVKKPFSLKYKLDNENVQLNERQKFFLIKKLKETNSLDKALKEIGIITSRERKNESLTNSDLVYELRCINIILILHFFLNIIMYFF